MWNCKESEPGENGTALFAQQIVSLQIRNIVMKVLCIPFLFVTITGILNNALNMLAFCRMGFKHTTNISLFVLSVADFITGWIYLFVAVTTLDMSGFVDLRVDVAEIQYLLAPIALSVAAFGTWVTAIINLERCFCIILPQKVERFFSRKNTIILITMMLFLQMINIVVNAATVRFVVIRSSATGGRIQVAVDRCNFNTAMYEALTFSLSTIITLICFAIIVVSTIFLGVALKQRKRWLQSLPGSQHLAIEKDRKLVRTVVVISTTFILCFLPGALTILATLASHSLNPMDPRCENLNFITSAFISLFQAISGMMNFFVYFSMSSNFRSNLKELRCRMCIRSNNQVFAG